MTVRNLILVLIIGVIAGVGVTLLFDVFPGGRWQVLPWAVLIALWTVLIIQIRRDRREDGERSE